MEEMLESVPSTDRWSGELNLSFEARDGVTRLVGHEFSGLVRASRPVYGRRWGSGDGRDGVGSPPTNARVPQVQMIHLGPGIMGGDRYRQSIRMGQGATARVDYQSYTKVLPGSVATQETSIHLDEGSCLWMGPNVVMPFADGGCVLQTEVHLGPGAVAFVPEVLVTQPVRVMRRSGETGQSTEVDPTMADPISVRRVKSTFRVLQGGHLILRDCLDIGNESLAGGATWTGAPVVGSVYVLGLRESGESEDKAEAVLAALQMVCDGTRGSQTRAGVSRTDAGDFVLRVLAHRVQDVDGVVSQAWHAIRGRLGG